MRTERQQPVTEVTTCRVIICDTCGNEHVSHRDAFGAGVTPAVGWWGVGLMTSAYGAPTDPPAGDYCSLHCLVAAVNAAALQAQS